MPIWAAAPAPRARSAVVRPCRERRDAAERSGGQEVDGDSGRRGGAVCGPLRVAGGRWRADESRRVRVPTRWTGRRWRVCAGAAGKRAPTWCAPCEEGEPREGRARGRTLADLLLSRRGGRTSGHGRLGGGSPPGSAEGRVGSACLPHPLGGGRQGPSGRRTPSSPDSRRRRRGHDEPRLAHLAGEWGRSRDYEHSSLPHGVPPPQCLLRPLCLCVVPVYILGQSG